MAKPAAKPNPVVDRFMSVKEACRFCSIRRETIYRWIKLGVIQAYGRTGCIRVRLSELMPIYTGTPVIPERCGFKPSQQNTAKAA
jgi:excisionase family DNA binding protein